jgi:hypothetical protein
MRSSRCFGHHGKKRSLPKKSRRPRVPPGNTAAIPTKEDSDGLKGIAGILTPSYFLNRPQGHHDLTTALREYSGNGLRVRYGLDVGREPDGRERHRRSVNATHRRPLLHEVRALRAVRRIAICASTAFIRTWVGGRNLIGQTLLAPLRVEGRHRFCRVHLQMALRANRQGNVPRFTIWSCRKKRSLQVHHIRSTFGTLEAGIRG